MPNLSSVPLRAPKGDEVFEDFQDGLEAGFLEAGGEFLGGDGGGGGVEGLLGSADAPTED